jgi:O-antigen/teichoic acid export membrane protein
MANSIGRKTSLGMAVTLFSEVISFFLNTISFVILSRMLSPDDFGLFAILMAVVAVIGLFKDFGLKQATIQFDVNSQIQLSSLFWAQFFLGLLAYSFLVLLAPYLLRFYALEQLANASVIYILGAVILLQCASLQHHALLLKNLDFKTIAIIKVIASLMSFLAAVFIALNGHGYWALIFKLFINESLLSIGYWHCSNWFPSLKFELFSISKYLKFGANLFAGNLIHSLTQNLDKIIIGKAFSPELVGYFTRAQAAFTIPTSSVNSSFQSVGLSILGKLRGEPKRYNDYYINIIKALTFLTVPAVLFLAIFTQDLVLLLIGEKWLPSVPLIKALLLWGLLEASACAAPLVNITRLNAIKLRNISILKLLLLPFILLIFSNYGLFNLCLAISIFGVIFRVLAMWYSYNGTPINLSSYLKCYFKPIAYSIIAFVVSWLLIDSILAINNYKILLLAFIYLCSYSLVLFVFEKNSLFKIKKLILAHNISK